MALETPSQKIPIRIDWTKDTAGVVKTQIVMNSNDFFASSTEISDSIKEFKKRYLALVKKEGLISTPLNYSFFMIKR